MRPNGIPVQRHDDRCTLTHGNCPGEYVYVKSTETHSALDGRDQLDKPWYAKAWDVAKGAPGDFMARAKATSGTVAAGEGLLDKASYYWNDSSQIGRNARSAYESLLTRAEIWKGRYSVAGATAAKLDALLKRAGESEPAGVLARSLGLGQEAWDSLPGAKTDWDFYPQTIACGMLRKATALNNRHVQP